MQLTATRIVIFRFLVLVLLFLPTLFFFLKISDWQFNRDSLTILAFLAAEAIFNLLYLLLVLRRPLLEIHEGFFFFQFLLDSMLIFAATLYTGGIRSPFFNLYPFLLVASSLALSPKTATSFALLLCLFPVTISYFQVYGGIIPGVKPQGTTLDFVRQLIVQDLGYILLYLLLGILPSRIRFGWKSTQKSFEELAKDLRNLRVLYSLVMEKIPSGIALLSEAAQPLFLNPGGKKLLAEFSEEEQQRFFRLALKEEATIRGEVKLHTRAGIARIFGYSLSPLPALSWGNYLLVFQDLTEIKEREQAQKEEERLRTLVRIAQNLAHEIRNPLGAIRQGLELLQEAPELAEENRGLLSLQLRECTRLEQLVRNFLSYAHPEPRWIRPISLAHMVEEFQHRYQQHEAVRGKSLEMEGDRDLLVAGDEELLRQTLDNLLLNAFQWSPAHGTVQVIWNARNGEVEILIKNQGVPIPPEHKERIFEPFFSLRPGGSGLGLAIAWSQARAMKGRLELLRSDEEGTIFKLLLPQATLPSHAHT